MVPCPGYKPASFPRIFLFFIFGQIEVSLSYTRTPFFVCAGQSIFFRDTFSFVADKR